MKIHIPFTLIATTLAFPGGLFAQPTVLLNDSFSNGTRDIQSLPSQSALFSSGESDMLAVSPGALRLGPSASSFFAIGYFTDAGATDVADGETLKLTIAFTMSKPANNNSGVRLALLDSHGKRTTADNNRAKSYNGNTGYAVFLNPLGMKSDLLSIRKRDGGLSNTLITSMEAYDTLTAGGSSFALENGVTYTLTLSLKNLGTDGMKINVSLVGKNVDARVSFADANSPYFSFDTIVLAGMRGSFESWKISNIRVETLRGSK